MKLVCANSQKLTLLRNLLNSYTDDQLLALEVLFFPKDGAQEPNDIFSVGAMTRTDDNNLTIHNMKLDADESIIYETVDIIREPK